MTKLFIIPGHGAGDPGAVGNGYLEAERVRALATRMKALGGADVTLADFNTNYYTAGQGAFNAIPKGYEVIELHLDSAAATARGGHVIIYANYASDAYDDALAAWLGSYFPGRSIKISKRNDLANPARASAAGLSYRLVEVCFISNALDITKFNTNTDEVAKGLLGAFGIAGKPLQPPATQIPGTAVNDVNLLYQAHCQDVGDLAQVRDGQTGGTTGRSLALEELTLDTSKLKVAGELVIDGMAHIAGVGWVASKMRDGALRLGSRGKSAAIECMGFKVVKNTTGKRLFFRVHQATYGWGSWIEVVDDGFTYCLGSTGQDRRLEAVQIKLV
ncbi:MAG: N-acetylmuramoyl-L-alanine amidase [Coriobacteriia bacterium]|nr:N-acetylmuramoyl-L-alanine amidase [Coriobacteriia bacterium]